MLRKMRRRFILAAMAAFGSVMVIVAAGINIVNFLQTAAAQDALTAELISYERRGFGQPEMTQPGNSPLMPEEPPGMELPSREPSEPEPPAREPSAPKLPGRGPEAEFTTRFFAVYFDTAGNVRAMSREHIASVDAQTAQDYARAVQAMGRETGYYEGYRYRVSADEEGTAVLFLNAADELHFMRSLLLASAAIGAVSFLVVFALVAVLSRYAIRPYARNIERQKQFITDAGHELKTPLASISTSADIAAMEHEDDEWIANIRKQTVRLTRLVNDLVALSRLDEETPFPEKTVFSLSDAAWEAAEPFSVRAKAEWKSYRQTIEEGLTIRGDRGALQRLISILLDNAVRYSQEGGEIRFTVSGRRRQVCLEVFNTCHLTDVSRLERVFDRFYRMDESRAAHTGGTGIGLSMAQAIAEAHGGRIEVESGDGESICFRVIL